MNLFAPETPPILNDPSFSMTLPVARAVAEGVLEELAGVIRGRDFIAGSVRRGKPDGIRDIDMVVVPHFEPPDKETGKATRIGRDFIERVLNSKRWICTNVKPGPGTRKWSLRSRKDTRVKIEIWIAFPWSLGWILLLRTGPSDFCKRLVTVAPRLGFHFTDGLMLMGQHAQEAVVSVQDERAVFHELGLPFLEPKDRSVEALDAALRARGGGADS